FDERDGLALFRALNVLATAAALALAAASLPRGARLTGFAAGVGFVLLSRPFITGFALGQGNGIVMVGLALGVWAVSRERWGLAGVGFGLATALKLSPGIALVYLAARGRWRAFTVGLATTAALWGGAAVVGSPGELTTWLRDVLPKATRGTPYYGNQSMPA